MIVTPFFRAAATTFTVLASIFVSSITPATASWSTPPFVVNSFWYSMRRIAVVFGSSVMAGSFVRTTEDEVAPRSG